MNLGRFTTITGCLVILAASGLAGYNQVAAGTANSLANTLFHRAVDDLQSSRDLTQAVAQVKVDVIQVQQWLTDLSATRGLDGLDDGAAEAESYAQKFAADLKEAQLLAAKTGSEELTRALLDVESAFPAYYDAGKSMAARYVAEGPAGGNPMMAAFDTAAGTMTGVVDLMEAIVDRHAGAVGENAAAMQRELANDQAGQATARLVTYAALILAIAIMTGFMAGYALRRIRAMSRRMTAIAQGDFSTSVYGSSVWEELKDIAKAADIFRQNGLRLEELKADEAVQTESRRVERQAMMASLQQAFGQVVDATLAGDFSRRVPASFVDPELNRLAESVNALVASIGKGLTETGAMFGKLAQYDLTPRMQEDQVGAFAGLRDDSNAVAKTLTDLVGKLRRTSGSLRVATSEILSGANDLSDRTTRQAATIEQTSAAMDQLATAISRNAGIAAQAGANSQSISLLARATEVEMGRATVAIGDISSSSAKIQSFIGVIDDIAFQTNLLALNASVEAARAGDAGKGFAVVAIEVRRLAQAAASAAREATDLVDTSMRHVEGGEAIILDVARRLSEVTGHVVAAAGQMESIALDSKEQSNAVEEVTVAIRQLDEMTQHNAALVEETNAAIEQTESQAQALNTLIGVFRVDERRERAAA